MWRSKKLIVGVVLAGVLLFGSLGGIALADDGDDGSTVKFVEFIDKVVALYEQKSGGDTIDNPEALKEAVTEAKTQMREAAIEKYPQRLTDEQKEALKEWWDSRPGLTDEQKEALKECRDSRPSLTDEQKESLKEWWDSRPEDLPMKFGGRIHRGFFRGMCRPPAPAE